MNDYQLDYLKELFASKKQPELMNEHVVVMKRCWAYWTVAVFANPTMLITNPGA